MLRVKSATDTILLVLITITAIFLRFENITQPFTDSFCWREASTAMMAQNFFNGNWNILYPEVSWVGPEPGYQGREFQLITYLAAVFFNITGPVDWVGRSVSAVFGVWGVLALFGLMDLVVGRKAALFGAATLAILPGAISVDRSFLPDGPMTALATTALWLLAIFRHSGERLFLYSAVGCWILASLVKLQALTITGPALYLVRNNVTAEDKSARQIASDRRVFCILSIIGGVVVFSYYVWAMHLAATYPPYHYAGSGKFIWDSPIVEWLENTYYLPQFWFNINKFLTPAGLVLVLIGLLNFRYSLLFHWWLLFFFIDFSLEAKHLSTDRGNLSIIYPICAGLVGVALTSLLSLAPGRLAKVISACMALTLLGSILFVGRAVTKERSASGTCSALYELGTVLKQKAAHGDLVVSMGLNPAGIYYSGLRGWVFPPAQAWHSNAYNEKLKQDSVSRISALRELEGEGARWLIIPTNVELSVGLNEHTPLLSNHINNHYELVYQSYAGKIFRYSTNP